jgi:hypothetical protein
VDPFAGLGGGASAGRHPRGRPHEGAFGMCISHQRKPAGRKTYKQDT